MKKVTLDSLIKTIIDESINKANEVAEKASEATVATVEESNNIIDMEIIEEEKNEKDNNSEAVETLEGVVEETPSITETEEYDPFTKGNNMIEIFQAMFGAKSFRAPKKTEEETNEEEKDKEIESFYDMDDEDDIIINSASIINLTISEKTLENNNVKVIASLHWLCKSITNKLFVLSTSYLVESFEEHEILLDVPFAENNKFVGAKVSDNMIMSAIPNFITDMEFMIENSKIDSKQDMFINAVRLTNKGPKYCTKFRVSNELFASMKFADNYIMDLIVNNHDISLASVAAGKLDRNEENTSELFVVDRLDGIIAIAPIPTKKRFIERPEHYAIAFKTTRYINKDETESATLMYIFNINKKLKKSKFANITFEKLQETYMKDFDRYTGSLMFMNRFKDYDKEFMCIKSRNKEGLTKIFMLDSDTREQLEESINEYFK